MSGGKAKPKDSNMKSVERFMILVFSMCALYLCYSFMKDLWKTPEPAPVNPWSDKMAHMFEGPVDFRLYGSQNKEEISAEDIVAHLSNGAAD